jgi:hypothetical protein
MRTVVLSSLASPCNPTMPNALKVMLYTVTMHSAPKEQIYLVVMTMQLQKPAPKDAAQRATSWAR